MSALARHVAQQPVSSGFDVHASLLRIRHLLPTQGPLKDFIHHNPLHAFQHLSWRHAVGDAAELFGARKTLAQREYLQLYRDGKIDDEVLYRVLRARIPKYSQRMAVRRELFTSTGSRGQVPIRLRTQWSSVLGEDFDAKVSGVFLRLVAQYLDQGIAIWPMPGAASSDFLTCIRALVRHDAVSLVPLSDLRCQRMLDLPPETIVEECLARLVHPSLFERYLQEALLIHPGWSGLVAIVEKTPQCLSQRRTISLLQFAALQLIHEVGILERCDSAFQPLQPAHVVVASEERSISNEDIWQEALEESYYCRVAAQLCAHSAQSVARPTAFQVVTCIDDRECSLRRHLETLDPQIETFGTAGFFGIDAMYLKEGELYPVQRCPVLIRPKHLLLERHVPSTGSSHQQPQAIEDFYGHRSQRVWSGLIRLPRTGVSSLLRLVLDVFGPKKHGEAFGLDQAPAPGCIHILRESEGAVEGEYLLGYSVDEMIDRVGRTLRSMGLVRHFAPIVLVLGHGSSSVNNPYFAAYDCGACSGKPGGPNARAFVEMANRADVRAGLVELYGIRIPLETVFVSALHDTCRDEVTYYDQERLPAGLQAHFARFVATMAEALALNAQERCRRFELLPRKLTPQQALKAVHTRSLSIFEPRPELNHATNAMCVVGRRSRTRGLSLDRRAFLQSYDPVADGDGRILAGILNAVIPVCGGINLEYFFSRIDPAVYGAGSKLPHNVVGLIGVINGSEGDLLRGLPTQMTEMHDPIRLFLIIEQQVDVVQKVLQAHPPLKEWIDNEWMVLAVLQPDVDGKLLRYEKGRFVTMDDGGIAC